MSSFFVLGSTGLCGSNFLKTVVQSPHVSKVLTLSRRLPKITSNKLLATIESDTSKWPDIIEHVNTPHASTIFSGFGTYMFRVNSPQSFVAIDHDVNIQAFKAAKHSGKFDTAILVSAIEADSKSNLLYFSTKGKIEEDLMKLNFKRTIILRPGAILGRREIPKPFLNSLSVWAGYVFRLFGLKIGLYPIYGEEVAKVGYYLSQQPIKNEGEVIIVGPNELLTLANEIKI